MPLLVKHCEQQDADRGTHDASELILICERQQLSYDAVAAARYRFEHGEDISLDFNTADRLLAGMRMWDAWYDDLREYYENVDLTWKTCACPGCEAQFQPGVDTFGRPKHTLYCSSACRNAAWKIAHGTHTKRMSASKRDLTKYCRNGHKRSEVGVNKSGTCKECLRQERKQYCRQGHKMTPDNTIITSNGHGHKTRCRICFNKSRTAKRLAA